MVGAGDDSMYLYSVLPLQTSEYHASGGRDGTDVRDQHPAHHLHCSDHFLGADFRGGGFLRFHRFHNALPNIFRDLQPADFREGETVALCLLHIDAHQKAYKAQQSGKFDKEIVPFTIPNKKGDIIFDKDEGIRPDSSMESLGKLKPVFKKDGIVTAGNSSQLSDGGSALIVASRKWAEEHGIKPLASIVAYGERGVLPERIMEAPIPTTRHVLKKAGMTIDDIDLFEHNEAFASASCAVMKDLQVPEDRFNVNGGAVALGHPIGCSGARVMTTLLYALEDRQKEVGCATLCLGGGNAVTMIVRRE
jgi:acetyl-CoA C-acetyltransferase